MFGFITILAGASLAATPGQAPLPQDTARLVRLNPLEVRVTRGTETRRKAPLAVGVVDSGAFRGAQLQNGLDETLGRLPGLYVANRFNPSLDQRFAIRGAGARGNFGVRGIKILLDGIPQTLPDGQSQLTNLDFGTVDRAEVLIGAASALYGNAAGGVVAFSSALPAEPATARIRALAGSFGTSRLSGQVAGTAGLWSGSLGVSRYQSRGVRQQSQTLATQLTVGLNRMVSDRWLFRGRYYFADVPEAANAGALTLAELAANRDSAAANNILRGADKAVRQHQAGLTISYADGRGTSFDATIFGLVRDLANPLATAPPGPTGAAVGTFSAIDRKAGGARFAIQRRLKDWARLSGGADFQTMRDDRLNQRSRSGVSTDTTVGDQRETVTEVGPFMSLHLEPTDRLTVTATTRYDRIGFRVVDRYLADGVDQSGSTTMANGSGSVGSSYTLGRTATVYGSVATAFETPTTTELVNQANGTIGFNRDLGPQRTISTEIGFRTVGTIAVTAAVYRSSIRDALVQTRERDGRAFFENAARLVIRGVEAGVSGRLAKGLSYSVAYTHTDAAFRRYVLKNGAAIDTLDGRQVPGIPRHIVRAVGTAAIGPVTAEWDQQIVSQFFADDRNTLLVEGWKAGVTSIRIRTRWPILSTRTRTTIMPFVAVNNLFDRRYVAAATVNGFGGRVFEPAPGRSAYLGIDLSLGAAGGR